jgi:hypothetical protein
MLDPKEQAKGGFRAQVARAEEQQAQHAHDAATASADSADAAPAAASQADGEQGPAPRPPLESALPTPPARPPKRWH